MVDDIAVGFKLLTLSVQGGCSNEGREDDVWHGYAVVASCISRKKIM
jgi:hypothetical protein